MKRRNAQSARKAKSLLTYGSNDVLRLYGVCRNTLNNWIRNGLTVAGGGRQQYFRGADLNAFHKIHADRRKKTCTIDEVYCVACKKIHQLTGLSVTAERLDEKLIRLHITCPELLRITCRVIRAADLSHIERIAEPIQERKQQANAVTAPNATE